jgi:hypothetical protein
VVVVSRAASTGTADERAWTSCPRRAAPAGALHCGALDGVESKATTSVSVPVLRALAAPTHSADDLPDESGGPALDQLRCAMAQARGELRR